MILSSPDARTKTSSDRRRRFWVGNALMTPRAYRARERAVKKRVKQLALNQQWIGAKIGRTRENVCLALNGKDPIPKKRTDTLRLIEDLLARVEAGEIAPGPIR